MSKQNSYLEPTVDILICQFTGVVCTSSSFGSTTDDFNNEDINFDDLI